MCKKLYISIIWFRKLIVSDCSSVPQAQQCIASCSGAWGERGCRKKSRSHGRHARKICINVLIPVSFCLDSQNLLLSIPGIVWSWFLESFCVDFQNRFVLILIIIIFMIPIIVFCCFPASFCIDPKIRSSLIPRIDFSFIAEAILQSQWWGISSFGAKGRLWRNRKYRSHEA